MPVYYATKSRPKAILWATVSGISEPIGGLIGWAVLGGTMNSLSLALAFSIVAGMMVWIAIRELIPTALRNDPEDAVVTYSCFGGMVVIASSLVAFKETS